MERTSLASLSEELLTQAKSVSSGRYSRTLVGGHDSELRQTVIAMCGGEGMDEHESPGEATLMVLRGRVRLTAGNDAAELGEGELVVIPLERHAVQALDDAVMLLTVVKDLT